MALQESVWTGRGHFLEPGELRVRHRRLAAHPSRELHDIDAVRPRKELLRTHGEDPKQSRVDRPGRKRHEEPSNQSPDGLDIKEGSTIVACRGRHLKDSVS